MAITGYHHIGLFVADMDKSYRFYVEGLGAKEIFSFPVPDMPEKTIYLVDLGGGAVIELIPRGEGKEEQNAHWAHIALETDDCEAAYALAIKAGAEERQAPNHSYLGTMEKNNAFVYGPDREVIEFFQVFK